jgi:hypothetical protein
MVPPGRRCRPRCGEGVSHHRDLQGSASLHEDPDRLPQPLQRTGVAAGRGCPARTPGRQLFVTVGKEQASGLGFLFTDIARSMAARSSEIRRRTGKAEWDGRADRQLTSPMRDVSGGCGRGPTAKWRGVPHAPCTDGACGWALAWWWRWASLPSHRAALSTAFGAKPTLSSRPPAGGLQRVVSADVTGRAHVLDGDTIEVGGVRVRLQGLHCPEAGEPGGSAATSAMRGLTRARTSAAR